jgi:hypothetical protein
MFKDVFAADLANPAPVARRAVAAKLLEQAAAVSDSPSDEFVLLAGAVDAAKDGSDLVLVSRAADALAAAYSVDGLHVKSEAASQMSLRADSPLTTAENLRAGEALVNELAAANDFVSAFRVLKNLLASTTDAATRAQFQVQQRGIESLKAAADRYAALAEKLKAAPDDPAANLAMGRHLCFIKGDWTRGLAFLARGGDPPLRALAAQELKHPTSAEAQAAVADAWWSAAESRREPEKDAIFGHARALYRSLLPRLNGFAKLKVQSRAGSGADTTAGSRGGSLDASRFGVVNVLQRATGPRNVIWFRGGSGDSDAFKAISRGRAAIIKPDENAAALSNPNLYRNVGMVVWGVNQWRSTPVNALTDAAAAALQQFVGDGGDLVIFEQFAMTNMGVFDRTFNIKTAGGGKGAQIVLPALRQKLAATGVTDDTLKEAHFYNSYRTLPAGTVVLARDDDNRDVIAVAPFGKGRLILIGTNNDASQRKLVDETLDLIYHWQAPTPGSPARR